MNLLRLDERPKGVKDPASICRDLRRRNGLVGIRVGKSVRYLREDVRAFIEKLRANPCA